MKKIVKFSLLAIMLLGFTTSCFKDNDDDSITNSDINDFVWKGMNAVYLYKAEIPDLANNRFSSNSEYTDYLNSFSEPEELFESLIYQRETVDRFSWITDDYIALEQQLSGTFKSNGLEFNFYLKPGSTTSVFGIIRLVLNNSVASSLNLQRGQVFDAINGTALTASNFNSLLNQDTYTLNFADYNDNGTPEVADDTIISNSQSVTLTKQPYSENPVYLTDIFTINNENVGYLVYNGFISDYNTQLNAAFEQFVANNVQHLVLDLRYNPGGSVNTAALLGSMITGQFNGQVFSKLIYNPDLQQLNTDFNFSNSLPNGGGSINSLNLDKVYVLTTNRSASASEMIINSLKEYITVVQIGANTTGKSQASVTIYDSPDFSSNNVNPRHTYAMQPLVAISVNKNNGQVPSTGLVPTPGLELTESPSNFGFLGAINEPLLAAALADIDGTGRINYIPQETFTPLKDKVDYKPYEEGMYIDNTLVLPTLKKLYLNQ